METENGRIDGLSVAARWRAMKLKRSTWIFLSGVVVAGIVLAAASVNTWRLERRSA